MDLSYFKQLSDFGGLLCYLGLAVVALWGVYSAVMVMRRTAQNRFRSEAEQDEFLEQLSELLTAREFEQAAAFCEPDPRALPQLALLAIKHRQLDAPRLRHLVADRFSRDVLSDLDHRLSWIHTVIRTAPMLGLFGTVLGMMSAFGRMGLSGDTVDAKGLADDISLALVTTAIGLAIAIPLTLCAASVNIRIRKLEDLVGAGLTRVFDVLKPAARASQDE